MGVQLVCSTQVSVGMRDLSRHVAKFFNKYGSDYISGPDHFEQTIDDIVSGNRVITRNLTFGQILEFEATPNIGEYVLEMTIMTALSLNIKE